MVNVNTKLWGYLRVVSVRRRAWYTSTRHTPFEIIIATYEMYSCREAVEVERGIFAGKKYGTTERHD